MGQNDKVSVKKEAQRKDLGEEETKKLIHRDELEKQEKRQRLKMQKKRDLEFGQKMGRKAIAIKKRERREWRLENRTKTGNITETVDMIKNPYKYNKNVKRNIQIKMKKKRNYANQQRTESVSRFKSASDSKHSNKHKQLRKRMAAKGNKKRYKQRRK